MFVKSLAGKGIERWQPLAIPSMVAAPAMATGLWTDITRARHRCAGLALPSDLADGVDYG